MCGVLSGQIIFPLLSLDLILKSVKARIMKVLKFRKFNTPLLKLDIKLAKLSEFINCFLAFLKICSQVSTAA